MKCNNVTIMAIGIVIGLWAGSLADCCRAADDNMWTPLFNGKNLDGWNRVEVIVRGTDSAIHIVNGKVVNRATDLRELDETGTKWIPLTKGRILLQAEGAEVLYRNIEIKQLDDSN